MKKWLFTLVVLVALSFFLAFPVTSPAVPPAPKPQPAVPAAAPAEHPEIREAIASLRRSKGRIGPRRRECR